MAKTKTTGKGSKGGKGGKGGKQGGKGGNGNGCGKGGNGTGKGKTNPKEKNPKQTKEKNPKQTSKPSKSSKPSDGPKAKDIQNAFIEIQINYNPKDVPTYGEKIAKALMMPMKVMGLDPDVYAFCWSETKSNTQLASYWKEMRRTDNYSFPPFRITDADIKQQKFVFDELRRLYTKFVEDYNKSHMTNAFNGDTPTEAVPFIMWSDDYARGIEFVRNMHILYPERHDYEDFLDEILENLQASIKTKADYQHFFPNRIKEIRQSIAIKGMHRIKHINKDPKSKIPLLKAILADLGLPTGGQDPNVRTLFDRVQKWVVSIPLIEVDLTEELAWLKDLQLAPTADELAKQQEKDKAQQDKLNKAAEKENARKEKQLAEKKELHCRPAVPYDGDVYYNDEGVIVMWNNGEELTRDENESPLKLPYVPCDKRDPRMCSKPENPKEGDIFYDERGDLVIQKSEEEDDYVILNEEDDFDVSKIIGKQPSKQIQKLAANNPEPKPPSKLPSKRVSMAVEPLSSKRKKNIPLTSWDAALQAEVIDVDNFVCISDIKIDNDLVRDKMIETEELVSYYAKNYKTISRKKAIVVPRGNGKAGKGSSFVCQDDEWKQLKNWQIIKLYQLMNDLSLYQEVAWETGPPSTRHKYAMECAKKLGFVPCKEIQTKQDLEKSLKSYVTNHWNVQCFYDRVLVLEVWIGKYTKSKSQAAANFGKFKALMRRGGYNEDEQKALASMLIAVADWQIQHHAEEDSA